MIENLDALRKRVKEHLNGVPGQVIESDIISAEFKINKHHTGDYFDCHHPGMASMYDYHFCDPDPILEELAEIHIDVWYKTKRAKKPRQTTVVIDQNELIELGVHLISCLLPFGLERQLRESYEHNQT